ncbi:hypothetical protein ONZ45_g2215 [Pleurotus djamor]|nr:hypothetical protein ONZ45_g2215 [Pleurotus djamor]
MRQPAIPPSIPLVYTSTLSIIQRAVETSLHRDAQISQQISVLNTDYNTSGISFTLASTTRTVNADWFSRSAPPPNSTYQDAMKAALKVGDAKSLNIYTVGFDKIEGEDAEGGLLGYSTIPAEYENNPVNDGVVILYSTLPGGSTQGFNMGRTLTHEVGHWLGLYHTFEGGCTGPGDYVDDTPAEAYSSQGCPRDRDTCPDELGDDPITNYMDYSVDSCMDHFTPGQASRMKAQVEVFRKS